MKQKIAEYAMAAATVCIIAFLLVFILGNVGKSAPEVGEVTVHCLEETVTPVKNEIYRTEEGKRAETQALPLEEAAENAPHLTYDRDVVVSYKGGSRDNGGFYFTIYDEALKAYVERQDTFTQLEEPGSYLVRLEAYWGTETWNIGMEYYFWLDVE